MSRPWLGSDLIRLKRFAAEGWTMAEAGQELGRSRRAIAGQARKYGIRFKGHLRRTWDKPSSRRSRNLRQREANRLYMQRRRKQQKDSPDGTPRS